jgi:hypothetical protein
MTKAQLQKMSKRELQVKYSEILTDRVIAIESNVKGTIYNPSDSDMGEPRVGFSDVVRCSGHSVANAWANLQNKRDQAWDMKKKELVEKLLGSAV